MIISYSKPLFPWDCIEDSPSLQSIKTALESIPDAKLLNALHDHRGKGRDDFPIPVLWGVFLLSILLRYTTMNACLDELRRNPPLAFLIGIENENNVPKAHNMSRFLEVLGMPKHYALLREIFDTMVSRLGIAIPDFGKDTAGDSTVLSGRAAESEKLKEAEINDGLPQPTGGRKEYKDDDGTVTKIVEWFGYKLHLLVDVKHEVILSFHITDTKTGDNEMIEDLVKQAKADLPADRIETMAYDKAADDIKVHEFLHEEGIKPLIQNRTFKVEEEEKVVGGRTPLNVVYDQAGTIYCYDKVSKTPVRHKMSYIGHEADRGTLKYRCPAKHEGWECPSMKHCNEGKNYGLTVRVKQEEDLRRFPPIPRGTQQFEEKYKGRTAIERVNGRMKIYWGIDDGQVYGSRRFHGHVGGVMIVHLAMATMLAQSGRKGPLGEMQLGPIAKKLRAMMQEGKQLLGSEAKSAETKASEKGKKKEKPPKGPTKEKSGKLF
jgi:hypothetical protein